MKKVLVAGLVLAVVCLFGLGGCCDCPYAHSGTLMVRLLNYPRSPTSHLVHFDVQEEDAEFPEASGSFDTTNDEIPEAYAMTDGQIRVFITYPDSQYDLHVYVDEDHSLDFSHDDTELTITDLDIQGETIYEADYSDFTPVN